MVGNVLIAFGALLGGYVCWVLIELSRESPSSHILLVSIARLLVVATTVFVFAVALVLPNL